MRGEGWGVKAIMHSQLRTLLMPSSHTPHPSHHHASPPTSIHRHPITQHHSAPPIPHLPLPELDQMPHVTISSSHLPLPELDPEPRRPLPRVLVHNALRQKRVAVVVISREGQLPEVLQTVVALGGGAGAVVDTL